MKINNSITCKVEISLKIVSYSKFELHDLMFYMSWWLAWSNESGEIPFLFLAALIYI